MGAFVDQYMPANVPGYPCYSIPRTNTNITINSGGQERRTRLWEHPLHYFQLPEAPGRGWDVIEALRNHWLVMGGPHSSWPFRDPTDFASVELSAPNTEPVVAFDDQIIGTGDGLNREFQLVKTYVSGARSYTRNIYHPVLSTVLIGVDGVLVSDTTYDVDRETGIVTFVDPVPDTEVVTAGFYFDVEVRFEDDDVMETIVRSYQVGGFEGLTLVEVRPC